MAVGNAPPASPHLLLPLLLLLCATRPLVEAQASWGDPFITADETDEYIKEFNVDSSTITIYEDVPIGNQIAVLHIIANPGDKAEVTQVYADEVQLSFDDTDITNQSVNIQSVLDKETMDETDLTVALNGADQYVFTIAVADINDNRPIFDGNQGSQISLDVDENKLNDSLLILTATDADEGATDTLTYSLDAGGYGDVFNLTPVTKDGNKPGCQLRLLQTLDYETRPLYRLTITVKDEPDIRGTVQSSSVTVFVNVQDVGDTAPRWLLPPMAKNIDEGTNKGATLLEVEAIDGDTSVNNNISYSIVSDEPPGFVELLDASTGVVTLKKDLDREDPDLSDGFITVVLQARETPADDPDQPCRDISCVNGTAIFTVNDLDDEEPQFDEPAYVITLDEGKTGSLGLSINVADADSTPQNNQISMELVGAPEDVFSIEPKSGAGQLMSDIRVLDPDYLDFEKQGAETISFQVVATGNKPNEYSASAVVNITLEDINDNDPSFTESTFTESVKETDPDGTQVIRLSATDDDASPAYGNASIRYTISGGGIWAESVTVDEKTGVVTLSGASAFDCERGADTVHYNVRATDSEGADIGKYAVAELVINVIDVDDTPPELKTLSAAEVMEEDPDATIAADITAEDADSMAALSFTIDWDNTVAKKGGDVVDPKTYDYTSLFHITSLEGDDTRAYLNVTGKGPDREMMDTITLRIVVNDTNTEHGSSIDQGDLLLSILDKNDNNPYFVNVDENSRFNVTENMPKTSTINQAILAQDDDQDNAITYSLTDGDTDLVAIDSNSGQLSVKDSIDREDKDVLTVNITVGDSGSPQRSNSIVIHIEVLDQNDNGPYWLEVPSSLDNLTVLENDDDAVVYTLTAFDDDKPDTEYSTITYSLSESGMKNFTVDPQSGEMRVRGTLDREVLADQNYVMTIQVFAGDACDADGNCAHKTEGLVRLTVLDDNDCPPVFPEQDGFLVQAEETISSGSQLKTVRATDQDEQNTDASKLTYTLKDVSVIRTGCEGNTDLFVVETDEGNNQAIIKAKNDLQGCWGDYNITLEATDGESPFNKGTGLYTIRILDVNDEPTVTSPEDGFAFDLPEDTYTNTTLPVPLPNGTALTIEAEDPDDPLTDNTRLSFRLLEDSTPDDARDIFYVVSDTGDLMLRNTLDRESSNGYIYNLHVEVTDHGENPLKDDLNVVITIADVDEFAPRFAERNNNATHFKEEQDAGKDTAEITSRAIDDDQTDIIFYFLVGGAKDVFELVDPKSATPQLRTKAKLDRETTARYQLILKTSPKNEQPPDVHFFDPDDDSQLNLTIIVDDINDMTPNFGNRRFMGGIAAKDPHGVILRLESDDPDVNDATTYSITSDITASDPSIANISDPFVLDPSDTSALNLNFDVSESMDGYFDFQVTAEDTAQHTNTTNVRIFIIIENDRVKFVFANEYAFVQARQNDVADALTAAFSIAPNTYVANIESVSACTDDSPPPCTDMITHFIDDDKQEPVPRDVIINLQFEDGVTEGLVKNLASLNLNLTAIGDTAVTPPQDDETIFQMLLIVVASVMGGILAVTCITSCIHTHKLRRQVKALSINAFGSRDSGLQNAGLAVPGSNLYANQGANPIFAMEDKKQIDAESVSSGDSVLIGVEDAPEFASKAGLKRAAPSAPSHDNPAYHPDQDEPAGIHTTPAVFDENSHHHMPAFEPDDDDDVTGDAPFGGGGGVTQNPLFGAGGGATQNPLFGVEMAEGDLGGSADMF